MKFEAGRHKTVEILSNGDRPQVLFKQRLGRVDIEVISIDGIEDLEQAIAGLQRVREILNSPESF